MFYYLADHVGSSRVMAEIPAGGTSATLCGACPERSRRNADFYPGVYPERSRRSGERAYTNTCQQNYKFTGKERDPESGLDNFEARYYGSSIARFTSPDDPFVGWQLNDPQSLNLYAYVQDNPINDVDPTGHGCYIVDGGSSMPCTFDDIASAMGQNIPLVGNTQGLPGVIGPDTAGNAKTNSIQAAAQANDTQTPPQAKEADQSAPPGHPAPPPSIPAPLVMGPKEPAGISGAIESRGQKGGQGKGEKGQTAKPDKPAKGTKQDENGRWWERDKHKGNWVLKPPGWTPDNQKKAVAVGEAGATAGFLQGVIDSAPEWLPLLAF